MYLRPINGEHAMTDLTVPDAPQLYLIAPVLVSETELSDRLAAVLDTHPVACLRLPGSGDEAALGRLADLVRENRPMIEEAWHGHFG